MRRTGSNFVRFGVLGPPVVLGEAGERRIGSRNQRLLLAALLVDANHVVSTGRLIESLWGDDEPADAAGALRTHVSRLRRSLPDPTRLTTHEAGYCLHVDGAELDACRFVTLFEASSTTDRAYAVRLLDDALELWRGAALEGFADLSFAQPEARRLEELRGAARERRAALLLSLGQPAQAAAAMQALISEHPEREHGRAVLMESLYRLGRHTQALAVYQSWRKQLADELGLDPSPALQQLERQILQHRLLDGETPAADIVRVTARSTHADEIGARGRLMSNNLPDPVVNGEVLWEPLGVTHVDPTVPLPGRLAVRPFAGVVGRDPELAAMLGAFKRVAAGDGREVVLVSGEAGLGKTTVISEACRLAFDGGACVLFGHCEEDLAAPYQLFSEALGHFVRSAPPQLLVDHAGSWGSALARLAPVLSSRLPGVQPSTSTDPGTERYQVFAAVVGLLVMVSRSKPVVLVLDDLQWADRASLQLLRHVVGVDQPMRLLVLGSYRDTELSHAHPLMATLADLHRHGGVTRLEVTGLNERGVALLLEAAGGHTLDDTTMRLAKALHRETDGNPFFVSELLRHLSNSGAIHHDVATGRWTAAATLDPTGLPASVRTVIGGRVGRLGGDAGRVLSLAAVIGQDFDLDLLARASTTGEDDILDILDTAIAAALVRELTDTPGHYSFAHALIQHTLYQDLGRTRRARAHRQVAEALEGLCGDRPGSRVGELARHWFSASHADAEVKALDYSRRAADAALAALAPGDALHYYTQALGLYARSDDRDPILGIDLAIGLGTAQRQSGDVAFRNTLLDAARRAAAHDDTDRLVAAALANNRGMLSTSGNVDTERVEMLELALDRLPADHPSRPLVLAKLCSEITYGSSLERRQALADEAVALAHFTGDDATIARVLNDIYWPMSMPHLLQQSLAWAVDALERAERLGDPVQLFWAADQRASLALRSGDIEEMDRCLGISWSLAERLNQPTLNWMRAYTHAMRAQLAGDTDEAETWATGALRIGTHGGEPDASAFCALQLGSLRRQRGTDGERIPLIAKLAAELPAETEALTASLARIYAEVGRLDDAHQLLEQFAAADFEQRPNPGTSLVTLIDYASAAIACRDTAIADALYDRLEPFADQVPINGVIVHDHISYFLGGLVAVLGCYDKGDAYYAHAAAFNERAGAKFFAARTNLAWARMLIERDAPGDTERARNLLAVAHASATTHRYPRVQRQTAEALGHADQVDLCRRHPHLEKKHGNMPAVRSRSSPVVVSSTCS